MFGRFHARSPESSLEFPSFLIICYAESLSRARGMKSQNNFPSPWDYFEIYVVLNTKISSRNFIINGQNFISVNKSKSKYFILNLVELSSVMSMLKNMQYQLLARQSMAPDSPLRRRSSFQQSINTSMPPPNSPAPSLNQTVSLLHSW